MLADYTSFIEAALALNAASIFVSNSKGTSISSMSSNEGYNASLLDFIFKPRDELKAALSLYESNLSIGYYSTQVKENIKSRKEELEVKISSFYKSRSFPQLSLWMFLFGLVFLLLAGLEDRFFSFSRICFYSLGIFTLGYLVLGWIFGEKKRKGYWWAPIDFSKPGHTINAFFLYLIISVFLGFLLSPTILDIDNPCSSIWHIVTLFFTILSVSNFVVYFIKMNFNMHQIRKKIEELSEVYKKVSNEII